MTDYVDDNSKAMMKIYRRTLPFQSTSIPIFKHVQQCHSAACPVFSTCGQDKHGLCGFEMDWLGAVIDAHIDAFRAKPDKYYMMVFGLQIVPLYASLCRLQKIASGMNTPKSLECEDHKGNRGIHNVVAAINSTISAINTAMRQSGLKEFMERNDIIDIAKKGLVDMVGGMNHHSLLEDE